MLDVLLVGAEELENLGTRYLAAVLRQHGYTVQLAPFSTEAEAGAVLETARQLRPRLVGLSIIFQYRAPEFLRLAAGIRETCHPRTSPAAATSPASPTPSCWTMPPDLDSVVRGEGEETLTELVRGLDARDSWQTSAA